MKHIVNMQYKFYHDNKQPLDVPVEQPAGPGGGGGINQGFRRVRPRCLGPK
jgi:hypothetical protein